MTKGALTDADYRDEILSMGPALADQLTWCSIWQAVKRETKAKHPNMDVKSEAFLKLCGERFSEVIDKTQVYDSVLSRSANMRSKDTGMKMVTAFLSEPTTSINMIEDAVRKGRQGDKKYAARVIGAVVASMIFNSALVSLVEAGRDDDDDQTYLEKYLESFTANLADGINPATYIPFVKDVVSIFHGYDVNRSDMSIFADIYNAFQQLSKDNVSGWKKVEDFAGSILKLAGIPLKNIMRDLRTAKQMYDTFTNGEKNTWSGTGYAAMEGFFGVTTSQQQQLLEAYLDDDTDHAARIEARYQDEKKLKSAVKSAIRERYLDGDIDKAKAREYLTSFTGDKIDDTYWIIKEWDHDMEEGQDEDFGKYDEFYTAVESGENLNETITTYTANGVKKSALSSQITTHFKPLYIELSETDRAEMREKVITALEVCGVESEDAEYRMKTWDFEADYGFVYADRKEAYRNSEITREQLRTALMEMGDYSPENADLQIEAYDWEIDIPGCDGVTLAALRDYHEYCEPYRVPEDIYYNAWKTYNNTESDKDENGESIAYSRVKKVMPYINGLNLTADQKTALALCWWGKKTVEDYKLW